jgi:hypothetical protein
VDFVNPRTELLAVLAAGSVESHTYPAGQGAAVEPVMQNVEQ